MTDPRLRLFRCPSCAALYQVIRAEAETAQDCEVACQSCGDLLAAREGKFSFKFLFLRTQSKHEGRKQRRRLARKFGKTTQVT